MYNKKKRFPISISVKKFEQKPTNDQWKDMEYFQTYMDMSELKDRVKNGYNYCHYFYDTESVNFGNSKKRTDNFKETFLVFFDIDDFSMPYQEFYKIVLYKPTFSYTTPSNVNGEKNRYRLIYQFDKPIYSDGDYKILFDRIAVRIKSDIVEFEVTDKSCRGVSQQMGGNASPNIEYNSSGVIYEFSDFGFSPSCNGVSNHIQREREETYTNAVRQKQTVEPVNMEFVNDSEFIADFFKITNIKTYDEMFEKYASKYKIFEKTPLPEVDEDSPYITLPDNYTEIKRDWYRVSDQKRSGEKYIFSKTVKIQKGKRHKILYTNAMLRRYMIPDISFEHLLFNLLWERQMYISNIDGAITNVELYKICVNAYKTESITVKVDKPKIKKKINEKYLLKHNTTKKALAAKIKGEENKRFLDEHYDWTISISKNADALKGELSRATVYRYSKEHRNAKVS